MKKDLRLLLWYVCCPLYLVAWTWCIILIAASGCAMLLRLDYFSELFTWLAEIPINLLNSIKEHE